MAAKQGFIMYYTKGVAIGTEVSVRYRESGRFSGVVVKRGSTVQCRKRCSSGTIRPQIFQPPLPAEYVTAFSGQTEAPEVRCDLTHRHNYYFNPR